MPETWPFIVPESSLPRNDPSDRSTSIIRHSRTIRLTPVGQPRDWGAVEPSQLLFRHSREDILKPEIGRDA